MEGRAPRAAATARRVVGVGDGAGVRLGVVLPIQARTAEGPLALGRLYDELCEEALAAEAAGFDAVFLPEFHQARGGAIVSPLVVGAGILRATTTIRFGTAVLALPLHHPVRLAEDVLMLDWMSSGRVVLGVGIGHQAPDFAAFGEDRERRAEVFEEDLDVLDSCFAGQAFDHHGRRWDLRGEITPAPYSTPRPELWIGAHSEPGLRRAGERGDLWLSDPQRDAPTIGALAATYRAAAHAAGRPARVGLFREAWIGDSYAECERVSGPHALAVHRLYYNVGAYRKRYEPWVDEVADRSEFTLERLAPGRFLYGSAEQVRATIAEWHELTGCEYLALRLRQPGGPSHAATLEAIARFGAEVLA